MKILTSRYSLTDRLIGLIKLMRPKQWVKNGFVFAALVFSGEMLNPVALTHAFLATLFFCVASSAAYIVNDIHDVDLDRRHPRKSKSRPLASGIVTKSLALVLLSVLYFVLALCYLVMPKVILVIIAYLILVYIKNVVT